MSPCTVLLGAGRAAGRWCRTPTSTVFFRHCVALHIALDCRSWYRGGRALHLDSSSPRSGHCTGLSWQCEMENMSGAICKSRGACGNLRAPDSRLPGSLQSIVVSSFGWWDRETSDIVVRRQVKTGGAGRQRTHP
jgi:hypothetical protein